MAAGQSGSHGLSMGEENTSVGKTRVTAKEACAHLNSPQLEK